MIFPADNRLNEGLQNRKLPTWAGYAATILADAAVTGILLLLHRLLPLGQFPISYVLVIMLAAYYFGEGSAILAFLLGLFLFDFFFVPPLYNPLPIAETPEGWAGIVAYLIGSSIVGFATVMIRRSKKRVEHIAKVLQKSEEGYRHLVEYAPTGIYEIDYAGPRFKRVNDAMCRILGYTCEELLELNPFELLDEESRTRFQERIRKALAGEQIDESVAFRVFAKDGREMWAELNIKLTYTDGRPTGALVVAHDITERKKAEEALKESEERYRQVIQNTTAIILRIDPQARITFANDRALEFFGYSADELIGRHAIGTIVPEQETTGRDLAQMVDQIVENPDRFHTNANENMKKNGERVWMEWTNSGIYDSEGRLKEFLSVGIDITDRVHAQRQARRAESDKMDFYRRTIEAATDGKLVICERQEIQIIAGSSIATWEIRSPEDLSGIRHGVTAMADSEGMDGTQAGKFVLSTGEAITNAMKHAGGGTASLHRVNDNLILVVSDTGSGIAALSLPEVALKQGYSTAGTLGMGYKVMIGLSDRVYLATGPEGTTVGIQMSLHPAEVPLSSDLLESAPVFGGTSGGGQ